MVLPVLTCAALFDEGGAAPPGPGFRWDGRAAAVAPRDDGGARHLPVMAAAGVERLVDAHTHWFPENVERKIWSYFDRHYWAITYRTPPAQRLESLQANGVAHFTTLHYAHRPGMAEWLNDWTAQFAGEVPAAIPCGTFYPEPQAGGYVRRAIEEFGFRGFKLHLRVADLDPADPLLAEPFEQVQAAGLPVVIHCGSAPTPGRYTSPAPMAALLRRYPRLVVIVAHMGAMEFEPYLAMAETCGNLYLDTTMVLVGPPALAGFPPALVERLARIPHKILFGSDFPNIPYPLPEAVGGVLALPLDPAAKKAILGDNAARLFGIGPAPRGG